MEKILEVKRLKISFRTSNGTLKAVRDISFDLERGKTLAIVGESGSGKSVTSRAIMGILAGNAIVEGGEIFYDGKDLLKIDEEEMHKLRGDKISMIFQDPLSSLNPIVKIGKQITEAMLLKNKTSRREARRDFNGMLATLKKSMLEASGVGDKDKINTMCATFDKFCIEANKLENAYNSADSLAQELSENVEDFLFKASKKQHMDVKAILKEFGSKLQKLKDPFLTAHYDEQLATIASDLSKAASMYRKSAAGQEGTLPENITQPLEKLQTALKEMNQETKPNFFCIGYYRMQEPNASLTGQSIEELNKMAREYLDAHFMEEFLSYADRGVQHSFTRALEQKKVALEQLRQAVPFYRGEFDRKQALERCKQLSKQVKASIDPLEVIKDSAAYTFESSLTHAIEKYFACMKKNPKEEARFARQTRRRKALIARGKHVSWKVIPKNVYDIDDLKDNIVGILNRVIGRYEGVIENAGQADFRERSISIVDFLKERASQVVYRVTKSMAKEKAIKLMEEVGIHEPRTRYYQYPFEFSGGMRQRIVIAIALAANPDILICDEPTTALDVTIQAQILELINKLKQERNLSVIFITHDLGVVANMADDIAVMYAGKIVEYGTADDIFYDPRHPYTWALLSSMPDLDTTEKLDAIPGTPPNMIYPPQGDAFADRNKFAMKIDFEKQPPMFRISETHSAATWLLHPDAPKVDVPKAITSRIERMTKAGGAV